MLQLNDLVLICYKKKKKTESMYLKTPTAEAPHE